MKKILNSNTLLLAIFKRVLSLGTDFEPSTSRQDMEKIKLIKPYFDREDGKIKLSHMHSIVVWQFVRCRQDYRDLFINYSAIGEDNHSILQEAFYLDKIYDPDDATPEGIIFSIPAFLSAAEIENNVSGLKNYKTVRVRGISLGIFREVTEYLELSHTSSTKTPHQHKNIIYLLSALATKHDGLTPDQLDHFVQELRTTIFINPNGEADDSYHQLIKILEGKNSTTEQSKYYDDASRLFDSLVLKAPGFFFI